MRWINGKKKQNSFPSATSCTLQVLLHQIPTWASRSRL